MAAYAKKISKDFYKKSLNIININDISQNMCNYNKNDFYL